MAPVGIRRKLGGFGSLREGNWRGDARQRQLTQLRWISSGAPGVLSCGDVRRSMSANLPELSHNGSRRVVGERLGG